MALSNRISQKISLRRAPLLAVNWRRLYALPTRHGLMVGLAVFAVFAISVRIQHNMLLLLAVALFVIFLISVIWGALNLHGLAGRRIDDKVFLARQPSQIGFQLAGRGLVYDLRMKTDDRVYRTDLYQAHKLNFVPEERGKHNAPPFLLETRFPFGLVRVWQWLFLPPILVAPAPDFQAAQTLLMGQSLAADSESDEVGEFNADSLENWQPGIPLSRISWKQYAAKDKLLYKTGAASGQDLVRLHFDMVAHRGYEAALSILCGGALLAHDANYNFEMQLPDGVAKQYSHEDIMAALRALALCPKAPVDQEHRL